MFTGNVEESIDRIFSAVIHDPHAANAHVKELARAIANLKYILLKSNSSDDPQIPSKKLLVEYATREIKIAIAQQTLNNQ
jgi:hypothetical protein